MRAPTLRMSLFSTVAVVLCVICQTTFSHRVRAREETGRQPSVVVVNISISHGEIILQHISLDLGFKTETLGVSKKSSLQISGKKKGLIEPLFFLQKFGRGPKFHVGPDTKGGGGGGRHTHTHVLRHHHHHHRPLYGGGETNLWSGR